MAKQLVLLPQHPPTNGPTLWLSNWACRKTQGRWGQGRVLTIMAAPREWEKGDGFIELLQPAMSDLMAARLKSIPIEVYQARFEARLIAAHSKGLLAPGHLQWSGGVVQSGDTLCCSCAVTTASIGQCHRAWAAPYLVRAGWQVILDGVVTNG